MPIYEYECTKCGHQTEVLQKFSDEPLTECEICHGKLKKLISHNTFHLKGTGWYVTDYASKNRTHQGHRPKSPNNGTDNKPKGSSELSKKTDSSSKASSGASKKKDS